MQVFTLPVTLLALAVEITAIWISQRTTRSLLSSAGHCFMANVLSTLGGIAILLIPGLPSGFDGSSFHMGERWWLIARISFIAYFVLSILVEGVYYRVTRLPSAPTKPWMASLSGNFGSYAVLAIFWFTPLFRNAA